MRKLIASFGILALLATSCMERAIVDPSPEYEAEARNALSEAARTAERAGSVQTCSTTELNITEEVYASADATGEIDFRKRRSQLTIDLGPFATLGQSMTGETQEETPEIKFTYIFANRTLYVRPKRGSLPGNNQYVAATEEALRSGGGMQIAQVFQDPADALYIFGGIDTLAYLGDEELEVCTGEHSETVQTRAFQYTIDPQRAIRAAPAPLRNSVRSLVQGMGDLDEDAPRPRVWIDSEGRVRQQLSFFQTGSNLYSGVRQQFAAWGSSVQIQVPSSRVMFVDSFSALNAVIENALQ